MTPAELLKKIHLFKDASPDELVALTAIAEKKSYLVEENVYRTGETPDALFIIEMGTVDVILKDKDLPTMSLGSGQCLGEMAFFERSPRIASAVTREPTSILRIPFDKLDKVLLDNPNLARTFYQNACSVMAKVLRGIAPDMSRRYF